MPLLQHFAWVGGFLLAALFAANWCCSPPVAAAPPSDIPLNQKINIIRIQSEHKWPERVVFDTNRSKLAPEATVAPETNVPSGQVPAGAGNQAMDAFAEMTTTPAGPCFRPPRSGGQAAERGASPAETRGPVQRRSRSSMAASRGLLSPIRFTSRQEEANAFAHEGG
jgi:hypothetical protein